MSKSSSFKSQVRSLAAAFGVFAALAAAPASAAPAVPIVPAPASAQPGQGTLTLADGARVTSASGDAAAARTAAYFVDLVQRTRGLRLSQGGAGAGAVEFRTVRDAAMPKEGYRLQVTPRGAVVTAASEAGLFYGAGSLWQLITADGGKGAASLQAVTITDQPRFQWRGFMLDSARHMQSTDYIRRLIDVMALHKLNVLHWHLTDDQAWRLEIKKYPRLTEVAAWRVPAGAAAKDIDPKTGKPRLYGGFYTQAEVRELVAYAAARHITIVPEIEMPGHALAPIVAYPELGVVKGSADNMSDWGIYPYLFNVEESTFAWLEDVLSEVMALFPSKFIHIGGDEAVKDQWKASERVQARMRELGVKDETALQGYFTTRIAKYLAANGRRAIGWDEILEGGLPQDAAVMSWRGVEGAVHAAKEGHDTVLAAWPLLYFDNIQSDSPDEPPGRGRVVALRDVYGFDPVPAGVTRDQERHILGVQANLWAEHIRTEARSAHMIWPREAAVAEIGWSRPEVRSWDGFLDRLQPWVAGRYAALGVPAADAAFEVRSHAVADPVTGKAVVMLASQTGAGQVRYTLDDTEPTAASQAYTAPLVLDLPAKVRANAFAEGRPLADTSEFAADPLSIRRRTSQELKTCAHKLPLSLEDDWPPRGERAHFLIDVMEPCWRWNEAPVTGVSAIRVGVGQVPFNFQIGKDRETIGLHKPRTPEGELEVRIDGCEGEPIAVIPLKSAVKNDAVSELSGTFPAVDGRRDLCFRFTSAKLDPMWALDWVQLVPGAPAQAPR